MRNCHSTKISLYIRKDAAKEQRLFVVLENFTSTLSFFVHVASRTGQDSSDNYNCIVDQSIYHSVSTEFYPVIIVLLSFDTFNIDAFRYR